MAYIERFPPLHPSVIRNIEGEFQPGPNAQLVERAAQIIFDDLFGGTHALSNFAVGESFPNQLRNLYFPAGQSIPGRHDFICSF